MTPFQRFCQKWKDGCGSEQCPYPDDERTNTRVVLCRGTVPCDVLFIGEAPGESENVRGRPFDGPAGILLDSIIRRAIVTQPDGLTPCWTYALTNLVCCIPRDPDGGKASEPDDDQVNQCSARLVEFVKLCDPQLLVCVGKLAEDWTDPGYKHSIQFHKICPVCKHRQWHCRSGWTCNRGHGGEVGIRIPRVAITHPAAILRMNVAQQGLVIQRCVVTLTNAVEEL